MNTGGYERDFATDRGEERFAYVAVTHNRVQHPSPP